MSSVIEMVDLRKVYPDGTRALDGVSLEVGEGEVFGFLGPNGAGKTTAIRILVTLLSKTSGTARVGGFDVRADARDVRRLIGYAGQFIGVDVDLSARENLLLQARLQGIPRSVARPRSDELLEQFALREVASKRAATLSGGMRRRLDLAQALVHRPPIVFLDEPTTGLDPQTRNALWKHLEEVNRAGTTIFMTTQYLEEADRLCHRIAIIDHGRLVVTGSPSDLKREIGGEIVTVELEGDADDEAVHRAVRAVAGIPGAGAPTSVDRSVSLALPDAGRALSDLVRRFDEAGVKIARLSVASTRLDDVFLKYTGERMRAEESSGAVKSSASQAMERR